MVKQNFSIQLGKMLQSSRGTRGDVEVPYLKAQHVHWFRVRTTNTPKMWVGRREIDQFGVKPGDLLVCEGGEGGRCGILTQQVDDCIIQNALHRVRPLKQSRNEYLQNVMSSIASSGWFDALNNKATIAHFTREKFGALRVPLPPLPEQAAIVCFLDHADRRIRRYIRAKQKLIALLEEQKQAIIHKAVTGQIDVRTGQRYPVYRPSSVEWLREVPEHWREISLGAATDSVQTGPFGSQLHARDYVNGGIPVINPSHMRDSSIEPDPSISISQKKAEELSRHQLKPDDIVMARRGEMGRCALVTELEADWLCGTGSLRIRPKSGIFVPAYLLIVLNTPGVRDALSLASIGATMDNLNAGMVSRLVLPGLPFPEQIAIVNFVDKRRTNIENAIDRSRRQINLLREYRTRLIADVVTGKLDVRDAAAELPEIDVCGDAEESAEEDTIETEVTA